MSSLLESVELATGPDPRAAVIWLHGLGADGRDFVPLVPALTLPEPTRFVFPHAPMRPVTINAGMRMRAWYDVLVLDRRAREDESGLKQSAANVAALVERERERGIVPAKIVLAGFSQGGAVALYWGLRAPDRFAGVLALSTYLPLAATLDAEKSEANQTVPLFMAHGKADSVVPFALALESKAELEASGYRVEWHSYPIGHMVCPEEVADLGAWLARVLAPSP